MRFAARVACRQLPSGERTAGPSTTVPVAVRHDKRHRPRIFGEQLSRQRPRIGARKQQQHAPTFGMQRVEVEQLIAHAVHMQRAVTQGAQSQRPRRRGLCDLAVVHDQHQLAGQLELFDLPAKAERPVHPALLTTIRAL